MVLNIKGIHHGFTQFSRYWSDQELFNIVPGDLLLMECDSSPFSAVVTWCPCISYACGVRGCIKVKSRSSGPPRLMCTCSTNGVLFMIIEILISMTKTSVRFTTIRTVT